MYYYFNEDGQCVMIYINDETALKELTLAVIVDSYGEAGEIVGSRVGKTARHYIYADKGFAFSMKGEKIEFF